MTEITVFTTIDDYVAFLSRFPIMAGEAFCLGYVPSCFFPKDSVLRFFTRHERACNPLVVADSLWEYGRHQISHLTQRRARMCMELRPIRRLCSAGQVHDATPEFEVGFAERTYVLRKIKALLQRGSLFIFDQPVPFTFRLHPPDGVLLDVTKNIAEQKIQGVYLRDHKTFESFTSEFNRLIALAGPQESKNPIRSTIDDAIAALSAGERYDW